MGIAYSGFCRHCVLFLGYSMWSDLSGLTSRIFSFQMIIYSRSKQEIIKECMDFMFEQSQVQNYLLQQLPVPYALLDGNGMIIWSNDAFHKIVGENRGKSLQQIFPNLNRNLLPSDVMHSISHIEYKKNAKREIRKRTDAIL